MDIDPDGSSILTPLAIAFVLIILAGLFACAESAIIALNDGHIRRLSSEGDKRAKRIARLIGKPTLFLTTVQTGKTICEMLAVASVTHSLTVLAIAQIWRDTQLPTLAYPVALVCITLVMALLILIFANLLPKRISAYFPEKLALGLSGFITFFAVLLRPLVVLLTAATSLGVRLMGQNPSEEPDAVTEEEIRMMVTVGEEKGTIEQSEKDMINNIFEFDDKMVTEVMTHRMEVSALRETATLDDALCLAKDTGHSRIPVYREDIDNIVGILYVKDLLDYVTRPEAFDLKSILHEPFYIPETARCTELFKGFQARQIHMAIVIDEYGGTYGLVTMEDLLETIVGNIQDEYDNERIEFERLSDTEYTVDGWMSVDEAEQLLGIRVPEDSEYDTIGGVIIDLLGDIPSENEHPVVSIGHADFTVTEVDERRISRLYVKLNPPAHENE